ncbi:hypothetical protein SAMN06264364_103197 [Quadrisphaera granulorum]|uniref:Uncharacterized protein n=1 Tax=Quadrisphaera granulorum TaxID=317664 RepID=A0A316AD45_9ACTN|nr:hypothetical protein BXY45_103197 [Quadrisphaera granulorum]SZE95586.1 hypothetical protein SAMN06264364_103197 [Quadrisphaera granulorum]
MGAHRPPRSVADLVVSIALLVVALVTALMTTFAGFMLVMASDSCGIVRECSTSGLTAGVGMSVIGPWVGLLGFGVWAVVRMARRRLAWWTSLAALLAAPVLWLAGAVIVWQAVGGGS